MQNVVDRLSISLLEVIGPLPTPCWLWQKSTSGKGYGQIWFNGKLWLTHRLTWFLEHGEIPIRAEICHHCDSMPCCNPIHLFIGNRQSNTDDMILKGRYFNGKTTITCTEADEEYATSLREENITYEAIAKELGVSRGQAWKLVNLKKQRKKL